MTDADAIVFARSVLARSIRIEDLPSRMRELARTIGLPATLKLVEEYGGTRIYVPKKPDDDWALIGLLGRSAAGKLTRAYGGEHLEVDRAVTAMRAARDRALIADATVHSVTQLALKYKLTARAVWNILRRRHELVQSE